MEKRYINWALLYGATAMVFGVFFREFTKINQFTGVTRLSVMHTHYFLLGMFFFLILLLLERNNLLPEPKRTMPVLAAYHVGLNITGLGMLLRGLNQVWGTTLSSGMDASISGISGIGHILVGVGIILLLLQVRKTIFSSGVQKHSKPKHR